MLYCKLQIFLACIVSNIIIKAAILGTPTLGCDFSGKSSQNEFAENGLVTPCKDPSRLDATLDALLTIDKSSLQVRTSLLRGLAKFNGPNDGKSHERVVDIVTGKQNFNLEDRLA